MDAVVPPPPEVPAVPPRPSQRRNPPIDVAAPVGTGVTGDGSAGDEALAGEGADGEPADGTPAGAGGIPAGAAGMAGLPAVDEPDDPPDDDESATVGADVVPPAVTYPLPSAHLHRTMGWLHGHVVSAPFLHGAQLASVAEAVFPGTAMASEQCEKAVWNSGGTVPVPQ
jgi:hypothetical protein